MSRSRSKKQNRTTSEKFINFATNHVHEHLLLQCAVGGGDKSFTSDELGLEKFFEKVEESLLTNRFVTDVSRVGNVVTIATTVNSKKYRHHKPKYEAMLIEISDTVETALQKVREDWFFAIPHPRDKSHQDKYAGRRDKHKRRQYISLGVTS